jgi:release factor glutamine methyltransferase
LDVLEVGPGMGHFVVWAAGLGANVHVAAVEINPAAVANVNRNAALHGVADRVQCALGDVYRSPVTEARQFDVIFWDPPFSRGDLSLSAKTNLERAVWDPGYSGLTQYITGPASS